MEDVFIAALKTANMALREEVSELESRLGFLENVNYRYKCEISALRSQLEAILKERVSEREERERGRYQYILPPSHLKKPRWLDEYKSSSGPK